jgi:hypothetical protein
LKRTGHKKIFRTDYPILFHCRINQQTGSSRRQLPPKQIAGFFNECLVSGVYDENNHVILLQPESAAKKGVANRLTHA